MLDDDDKGEGEPIPDDGPEWGSIEEECAYWKKLAQEYGAKLKALECAMAVKWTIEPGENGKLWVVQREADVAFQIDSLTDIAKKL